VKGWRRWSVMMRISDEDGLGVMVWRRRLSYDVYVMGMMMYIWEVREVRFSKLGFPSSFP